MASSFLDVAAISDIGSVSAKHADDAFSGIGSESDVENLSSSVITTPTAAVHGQQQGRVGQDDLDETASIATTDSFCYVQDQYEFEVIEEEETAVNAKIA